MHFTRLCALGIALAVTPAAVMAAPDDQKTPRGSSFVDALSVSGTVSLTSDYTYRGVTQNDEHFTPQAGIEVAHESGLYAGIWGSTVDFNDGREAKAEADLSLGYRMESGQWSGDLRYTYYAYPGARSSLDYDYSEFSISGAYDFGGATLGAYFGYSPEFFAASGEAEYIQAKLDVPLPHDFSAHAYLGKQYVEDNGKYGYPDTVDWNLGFGYSYNQFGFDLSYIDTDLSKAECADGCGSRIVGTVTYNF